MYVLMYSLRFYRLFAAVIALGLILRCACCFRQALYFVQIVDTKVHRYVFITSLFCTPSVPMRCIHRDETGHVMHFNAPMKQST